MIEKINKIILPYFLTSALFFIIYCGIFWLIHNYTKIDNDYLNFWFPILISAVIVWFYLRKILEKLVIPEKQYEFSLFLSWALLAAPIITFIFYISTESGTITYLKNTDEIFEKPHTKYYSIKNAKIDKNVSGLFVVKSSVGRGNEVGIGCYFTSPILNKSDSIDQINNLWIGVLVGEKFSNRVFDDKQKQQNGMEAFIDKAKEEYPKNKVNTNFLFRVTDLDEKKNFLASIQTTGKIFDDDMIILTEGNGSYNDRNGSSLLWTIILLFISNLTWILMTIFQKLKKNGR